MTGYARSLPHLGFDPAPGDVGLTQALARRHYQVAQETRLILAMVGQLDLTALRGRAADALRAVQATFPPALRSTADAAQALHAATSSWVNQLSGFQAEADALERKAANASAHQRALRVKRAALPPGSPVLDADLASASADVARIQDQARELHQRYLTAAGKAAAEVGHSGLWDRTEPVRTVLEAVLAPFDIVAADHWVEALEKIASVPAEWEKELDEPLSKITQLMRAGESATQELIDAGYLAESAGSKIDAWYAFAPGWLKAAAGSLAGIKGLSCTLSGLGLLADAGTIITPQDTGTLGVADRVVAGTNATLITLNLALDGLPVVGDVVLAGTGLYLAGDYLYHHWTPFRDVADEVGHGTVKLAGEAGHEARSAWHTVTSTVGSWF